ncbi:uncharacterized protein LOC141719427 [Apium graveolens]|uniref:uncharacterized protein LOC141719427 n=1 Tax=Apium graveolens TaxID=4045 RepID=UPI003D7BD2FB
MARDCKEPVQQANVLRITGPPPPALQVQPRARTFNMTMKDVVQDSDVIAGPNLVIEVANQDKVSVDRICPSYDIEIGGRHFFTNLIPFKLGEFDIILGMDWLADHDAQNECKRKKVRLKSKDDKQGCKPYLAHVVDSSKEPPEVEEILIVNEFPDVFPDELIGLPPDREKEFTIDLAPGTEPVSKAPYRMVLWIKN